MLKRRCQRAFSCSHYPPNQQEGRARRIAHIACRQREKRSRLLKGNLALVRRHLRLIQFKGQNLPTHISAIARIKRQQFTEQFIARLLNVGVDKRAREIRSASRIKLHREKGNLSGYIAIAKALIEFNAINHRQPTSGMPGSIADRDMLKPQIAMTIADTPFGDSFGKERCAGLKKMADGTGNMVVGDRINRPAYIRQCLSKVFLPIAADHGALAKRGDMGISLYSLMKGGNKARYLFEKFRPGGSSPHTRFQRRIIRQTLHNDRDRKSVV